MDSEAHEENKESEYDWSELDQPTPDTYQLYVFLAHILLGIIISVLSFSDGWLSWGVGLGALPPLLLAVTGGFYGMTTGINWYRNEFIPYLTRIHMTPEFETDRFLTNRRVHRFLTLIAGYISLVISQYVWTQITTFLLTLSGDSSALLDLLSMIYIGLIFFHAFVLILFIVAFDFTLKSVFSDVRYILEMEEKMQDYFREKRKKEKEAAEARKKAEKEATEARKKAEKDAAEENVKDYNSI